LFYHQTLTTKKEKPESATRAFLKALHASDAPHSRLGKQPSRPDNNNHGHPQHDEQLEKAEFVSSST
jgi:hypothetical protein